MTAAPVEQQVRGKLWANSADSHFIEPADLWQTRLPKRLADLVPRSEKDPDGQWESIHVDGQMFRRRLPSVVQQEFMEATVAAAGSARRQQEAHRLGRRGHLVRVGVPVTGHVVGVDTHPGTAARSDASLQ